MAQQQSRVAVVTGGASGIGEATCHELGHIPPSSIDTPMLRQSQAEGRLGTPEQLAKRIPMGHMGSPDDIAAAVGFLCSEEAGFITGQVLGVNGGSVM